MESSRKLDAIIIADSGVDTLSGTNPLKLKLDGQVADIQVVVNYIKNKGKIVPPVNGDNVSSWSSAPKLNGIFLYSHLVRNSLSIELIQNFSLEKKRFQSLLSLSPKAVIISTPFIFFKQTLRALVAEIRTMNPDVYIIAGGAFIHYSYLLSCKVDEEYETEAAASDFLFLEVQNEPEIDLYIASPRGEEALCKALSQLTQGKQPVSVENSIRLVNGTYVYGPRVDDVSNRPPPIIEWELLPDSVFSTGVVPIQASNGCPYNCFFCNFTKDRRLTYIKPLDQLIEELRTVQSRGIRYVWFVDDNFRLGKDDLSKVCRRLIDEKITVKWMCFIRASTLKKTNLDLLREAGCIEVQIGLESGDPDILTNMNKMADPEMYRLVVNQILESGINVSCYFISGFPGETDISAERTRKFIRSIENPDAPGALSWSIYPFLLSPLSPVYEPESRKKYGLKGYMTSWAHNTMDFNKSKQLVAKAFLELENSGQIYRGDNLDIIMNMTPQKRKLFYRTRHIFSKQQFQGSIETKNILRSFKFLAQ